MACLDMDLVVVTDTTESVSNAVDKAMQMTKFSVKPDIPIIIKPNLCCIRSFETGATTDPSIVEALVRYIKRKFRSKKFYIVESNATALNADLAFKLLGYEKLAYQIGAKIINLTSIPFHVEKFPRNNYIKQLKIPAIFRRSHFLISAAKLKTNSMCGFTGTLKNMYGCNPEPYKAKYHQRLHEAIADIASAFRPDFSIVDAVVAMQGSGPVDGTPVRMNRIIAGNDPVAVDVYMSRLIGINPNKVPYLKYSERMGAGSAKYQLMTSNGLGEPLKLRRASVTEKLVSEASRWTSFLKPESRS